MISTPYHHHVDSIESLCSTSAKMALYTCQKFCQAQPEGKAILIRTWYSHANQRNLEEQMTQVQRDTQKSRIRKGKQTQLQFEVPKF
jgi:hypothetical protein